MIMRGLTILISVVLMACSLSAHAEKRKEIKRYERPRLVVGVVVDQMRWDYLPRYYDKLGNDGLRRLIDDGYSCDNTMINYVPTVTAVGHASIYTGATPALHGIAGNNFKMNGRRQTSVRDTTVATVGTDQKRTGQASPRLLLASTIGDQLKIDTDFRSKVVGVSFKDRAAVLPAGHTADMAFWLDVKELQFVTSTYYMKELPEWVKQYNSQLTGLDELKAQGDTMVYSPEINRMVTEMAMEAVKNEQLGQRDVTDMLCISYSQTDYLGHRYGTRDWRVDNMYIELDKQIARLLQMLDKQVGRGNYLLFLTADHGAIHNPMFMYEHKMPGAPWRVMNVIRRLDRELMQDFGVDNLVMGLIEYRLYLDDKVINANHLNRDSVKAAAVRHLRQLPRVAYAVAFDEVATSAIPDFLRERIIRGWHPQRSGDIQIVLDPGYVYHNPTSSPAGSNHAAWNPYDSHIPLLFYGWHVPKGCTSRPTYITDIAATVCSMIHLQMPNACIGNPIEMK